MRLTKSTLFTLLLLLLALLYPMAQAHMYMSQPPALGSKDNKFTQPGDVDYSMTSPLAASGADFPCKGHLKLLNTPSGSSVAQWKAGSSYELVIKGGARHDGGSCQASLSYDAGRTWAVIHSFVGDCPPASGGALSFRVPGDAPSGDKVLFGWSWLNRVGNREMYMNCAVVDIAGGGGGEAVGFSSRPPLFAANVNNGCTTKEGIDTEFPNPGPSVSRSGSSGGPPVGSCGGGGRIGVESGQGQAPGAPSQGTPGVGGSGGVRNPPAIPGTGNNQASTGGGSAGAMPPTDGDNRNGYRPGNEWPTWFNASGRSTVPRMVFGGIMVIGAAAFLV